MIPLFVVWTRARQPAKSLLFLRIEPDSVGAGTSIAEHPLLSANDIRTAARDGLPEARALLDRLDDPDPAFAFLRNEPMTGRRPAATADDHAVLAWAYVKALEVSPSRPWVYLGEITGVDADLLRGWLADAKRHKPPMLTRPGSGKAGGDPTDEARTLLEDLGYALDRDDPTPILLKSARVIRAAGSRGS